MTKRPPAGSVVSRPGAVVVGPAGRVAPPGVIGLRASPEVCGGVRFPGRLGQGVTEVQSEPFQMSVTPDSAELNTMSDPPLSPVL